MATPLASGKTAKPTNTSIAAAAWGDQAQMVVYWQDSEGWIRVSYTTDAAGTSWTGGSQASRLFRAKQATPLAAISWGNCQHVRIYYLDDSNILQEQCWDGSWYSGALGNRKIQVDPRSKLTAACWSDEPQIRVYYQLTSGYIQEVSWQGGGWQNGATLQVDAALGTALAVAPFGFSDMAVLRLFYQGPDNHVHEQTWDTEIWKSGGESFEAIKGTAIGAISVTFGSKHSYVPLRLYFEKARDMDVEYCGGIVEMAYQAGANSSWSGPLLLSPSIPNTPFSVCAYGDQHIRFFFHPTTPGFETTCSHDLHEFRVDHYDPTSFTLGPALPTL